MPKRGPTDTDRQNGEADVEVVNAAGERKAASLPKRLLAAARDTVSMTDEQNEPSWTDELADPEQTIVTGNSAVAATPERREATLVAYRQQHTTNTQRVAEQAIKYDSQMVEMDKHARDRVYDIGHLTAIVALRNEAAAQLQGDGWGLVLPKLIDEFAAEIDGWRADRGIG